MALLILFIKPLAMAPLGSLASFLLVDAFMNCFSSSVRTTSFNSELSGDVSSVNILLLTRCFNTLFLPSVFKVVEPPLPSRILFCVGVSEAFINESLGPGPGKPSKSIEPKSLPVTLALLAIYFLRVSKCFISAAT